MAGINFLHECAVALGGEGSIRKTFPMALSFKKAVVRPEYEASEAIGKHKKPTNPRARRFLGNLN